jgi:hypothetical protein
MFENTRKVLDEFEKAYGNILKDGFNVSKDDEDAVVYFSVHLARALMQDEYVLDESVAKIILATRNLSNEITVKVE